MHCCTPILLHADALLHPRVILLLVQCCIPVILHPHVMQHCGSPKQCRISIQCCIPKYPKCPSDRSEMDVLYTRAQWNYSSVYTAAASQRPCASPRTGASSYCEMDRHMILHDEAFLQADIISSVSTGHPAIQYISLGAFWQAAASQSFSTIWALTGGLANRGLMKLAIISRWAGCLA